VNGVAQEAAMRKESSDDKDNIFMWHLLARFLRGKGR
jgi:hypothetical protein